MEDVTDFAFREIVAEIAPPDVFFTEFTNVAGLMSDGRENVARRLKYSEKQRPIVAQIWGTKPQNYYEAAKFVAQLGFDGIDINMGCPQRSVIKHKAGSALIKNPKLAAEIIQATKKGVGESGTNIPVSVKTRIGFKNVVTEEWAEFLLRQKIAALTIHGRTQKQMSKVPADWEEIGKVVKIRNSLAPETLIIGNGDVESREEALEKAKKYGTNGVMIGRGIFQNPWVFEKQNKNHTKEEYLELLLKHTRLFVQTWGEQKNFNVMKKFFKMYVREFEGAGELRAQLMHASSYKEVETVIKTPKTPVV